MEQFEMRKVDYPAPHVARTQAILKAHPEISKLFGNTPSSAIFVFAIVALQIVLALSLSHSPWWVVVIVAYVIGAFADHAMFVLIHECTHNLVFRTNAANSLLQIIANFPIIFPSAISFRIYHIKHHIHQGDMDRDADLPRPHEIKWVGNSSFRKALWYLCYFVSQLGRIPYMKGIPFITPWVLLNLVCQFTFLATMVLVGGWNTFFYLALSTIFSIGLHPVGARWIQEHFVTFENQETYSYYGPLNHLSFNVGYHNEHHDFMRVAWSRLPQVRKIAPEFYDTLYYHRSWTGLLIRFIRDPKLGLFSRVIR